MYKLSLFIVALAMLTSCGKKAESTENASPSTHVEEGVASEAPETPDVSTYDPNRGEGKYTDMKLSDKLDVAMATAGESVAGVKCTSCHKLTDDKLVGPGWKGVTSRHKPEWIMNFITNPDAMIDKDPKLQAELEICLVRMPNQGLDEKGAREVLEFMRKNDGVK